MAAIFRNEFLTCLRPAGRSAMSQVQAPSLLGSD
jgi:hypothetical protein